MAISPLNIATRGYLNSPLAVATQGYLGIEVGGGDVVRGGGAVFDDRILRLKDPKRREQVLEALRRDDEEALLIVLISLGIIE